MFLNSIDLLGILSFADWCIFTFVLLLTLLSVLYGHRLNSSPQSEKEGLLDLLIMGRKLTLPLFVATLVATWYGGIFGVTQIAFESGIYNFITQGLFWYVSYLVFALFLVDKISPYQAITLPDLIGKMFGPRSSKLSAVFNFFNVLPIAYTISIGLFIQILTGLSLHFSMVLGVGTVLLYSTWGGLRAVVFSDLIQFFFMFVSVVLVLLFSIHTFGGLIFLKSNLSPSYFTPTGKYSIAQTMVWGFIALSTLVDPNFYQRCFAARSGKVAKKGILISTLFWIGFDLCTTFGAMYAKAVIPASDSKLAYLIYAVQLLPDGLRGLFLAGILATILSTLDSYLFLAGTTLAYDLPSSKLKQRIKMHHIGVILSGILSIVVAGLFKGNIKTVWKILGSYSAACLLLPVMMGHLFPQKISDNQFIFACLSGVVGTTVWHIFPKNALLSDIDALYIGILTTTLGLICFIPIKKLIKATTDVDDQSAN